MLGIGAYAVFLAFVFGVQFSGSKAIDASEIRAAFAGTDAHKVAVAALFGCLGSVVSLLMRLTEFETTRGRSREFLFLSGATLPIVGGIFAAVIAALLASKIINFGPAPGADGLSIWLFIVIGFLSGFSERFTRNLLSMAEDRFSGSPAKGERTGRARSSSQ